MKRISLTVLSIFLCISSVHAGDSDIKDVRGTSLAELSDAFEILRRFSSVNYLDGIFYITGKGPAVIFVDGRRLEKHIDLTTVPASSVEKVEIISEPRPEYDNNDGVVLITLVEAAKDEFHLTDVAGLTVSPYAGGSNDTEISGRKNNLFYEGGLAVSYLGTKDSENRSCDSYVEKADKSGIWLDRRKVMDFKDIDKNFSLTVKGLLGYHITPKHQLSVRYEYEHLRDKGSWDKLNNYEYVRKGTEMDLVNPSSRFTSTSESISAQHTHKLNLSYRGEADGWKFDAHIDIFGGVHTGRDTDTGTSSDERKCTLDEESRYKASESYSRFNVSHPLWKGNILFGMSLDSYLQNCWKKDHSMTDSPIHNSFYNLIPGVYASLMQNFGFLKLDAGIHYQHFIGKYSPYEDDRTLEQIRKLMGKDFIPLNDWLLHPHLTVSVPAGKVEISAGVQTTTEFAQYSSYSVNIDYLKKGDATEAFAYPGQKEEFFLKGEWEWIQLKGWGTYNYRPVFTDIDGGGDFNGPGFWSMDWKLSLSPTIGIWKTDLTASLHTQWLHMETVDQRDKLTNPYAAVNWINSFTLPWGMRIDISTLLRTKGAESNIYYRNMFYKAGLSVHQSCLKDRLVVSLGIENLLRNHQEISYYTRFSDMEFNWNDRLIHRLLRFSVKFTL